MVGHQDIIYNRSFDGLLKFISFLRFHICNRCSSHCTSTVMRDYPSRLLQVPEAKIAEFANSVDLDEVAHNEPPHLDLHWLPSSL